MSSPSTDAALAVSALLEQAFSGQPFLYPAEKKADLQADYRSALEPYWNRVSTDRPDASKWYHSFNKLESILYGNLTIDNVTPEGLVTKFVPTVKANLTEWVTVFKLVENLEDKASRADTVLNGDSLVIQQWILKLHADGVTAIADMSSQIDTMKNLSQTARRYIEELHAVTVDLRAGWIQFANDITQYDCRTLLASRPSEQPISWWALDTPSWRRELESRKLLDKRPSNSPLGCATTWSDLIEMCETSLKPLLEFEKRFESLRTRLENQLSTLSELSTLCLNLYGNVIAGASQEADADATQLQGFGGRLRRWINDCPSWDLRELHTFGKTKMVHCGTVHNHGPPKQGQVQIFGDDPQTLAVTSKQDIQVGINYFNVDWEETKRKGDYSEHCLDLHLEENAQNAYRLFTCWRPKFSGSRLSWIQVPSMLRKDANFGHSQFSYENNAPKAVSSGADNENVEKCGHHSHCFRWLVKNFSPLQQDNYEIRTWIAEVCAESSVEIEVENLGRQGFRIHMKKYEVDAQIWWLRIGWMVYSPAKANGFHAEERRINPLSSQHYVTRISDTMSLVRGGGNFAPRLQPIYIPFPVGKFHRRPAVAVFLSGYWVAWWKEYCLDIRFAATRDGVIISPFNWDSSWWAGDNVFSLSFQVLAIANE